MTQRGTWFKSVILKWGVAVAMTCLVTFMLLYLAGVFHAKVPVPLAAERDDSPPAGLQTAVAQTIRRPRYETATGTVKPVHEAAVASKLLAKVAEMHVVAGQSVEMNEVLVRLEQADLLARFKQAEAALANANIQREKADADFGRAQQLKERNVISQADFDSARSAQLSGEAMVNQATEALREAQVMLDYATIRAPMKGTVIDKRVEVGDTVTPGQVLLNLYDPTHMQMVASVRESLAINLQPGQRLPTRLDALNFACEATISEVVPEADVSSRSFTVKVSGPCPPGAYSGMFGRLLLPLEEESVLVIPGKAVISVGQLTLVDVVQDKQLSRRYVRLGRTIDDNVEVLAGLSPGDTVAIR